MAENDVEVGFGVDLGELNKGFSEAADKAKEGAEKITESFNGIGETVEHLQGVFLGLGTAILSGFGLKEVIDNVSQTTLELDKMSHMLGMSVAETRDLDDVLKIAGTSLDEYAGLVRQVTMHINQNEQAYKDAGVTIRDQNGNLLATDQIIQNIVTRLGDFKEGQDRNTEAMRLAGRGYAELIALQRADLVDKEEVAKGNRELAEVMGEVSVEAIIKYNTAMMDVKDVIEAAERVIASDFMPIIGDMGSWFGSIGPGLIEIFKGVLDTLVAVIQNVGEVAIELGKTMIEAFSTIGSAILAVFSPDGEAMSGMELFKNMLTVVVVAAIGFRVGIQETMETIKYVLSLVVVAFKNFADVAWASMHLDFAGVKAAYQQGLSDVRAIVQQSTNNIVDIAKKGREDMDKALLGGGQSQDTEQKSKGTLTATPTKKGAGGDQRLAEWKAQLQQLKEADNDFFKDDLDMEEQFWQQKLALVTGHSKSDIALRRQINTELYNIHKQQAQQDRQLDEETIASAEKLGMAQITMERSMLTQRRDMKQITAKEEMDAEIGLANSEYSLQLQALQDKYKLYQDDKVQRQKILDEMRMLDVKHSEDLLKIHQDFQKQDYELQRSLEEEKLNHKYEMDKLDIDAEKQRIDIKKQLGIQTDDEKVQSDIDLNNRLFDVEMQHLQDQMNFYQDDQAKYQELLDKKEQMTRQHQLDLEKINDQTLVNQQKTIQSMLAPITSAIDQSINGMIQGTLTWQKALQNIFRSILGEFVSLLSKMVAQWIQTEILKTTATEQQSAIRTGVEQQGILEGLATQAASAIKSIMNNAAQAFSGVWSALAGIPIIGPELAAAEAPMAFASVAAMTGSIASSAGGDWMIPSDRLNMVHKKETILPADKSQKLDDMLNSGSTGGMQVHIHSAYADAAGIKKLFMDHGSSMADAMRRQARQFKPMTPR